MKRTVIILGAGAAIPWDGPTTWSISKTIIDHEGFKTTKGLNVAAFICKELLNYHLSDFDQNAEISNEQILEKAFETGINFETIINALEDLYSYYFNKTAQGATSFVNSRPAWFELKSNIDEIFNFDFKPNTGVEGRGTVVNRITREEFSYCVEERKETLYLSEIIKKYMGIVSDFISGYDYSFDQKEELNKDLVEHLKKRKVDGQTLRIYTTNYDHLWPKITAPELPFFNGFEEIIQETPIKQIAPNIRRILQDRDSDCYYNLHGSIYFDYKSIDVETGDKLGKYIYQPDFSVNLREQNGVALINPSEGMPVTNIITGYSKVQRTFIEPIKAFHHSLSLDCLDADEVISIGYSYSDHHINRAMNYGFRDRKDTPITHVGFAQPNEYGSSMEFKGLENTISSNHELIYKHIIEEERIVSKSGMSQIFLKGVGDYLKNN